MKNRQLFSHLVKEAREKMRYTQPQMAERMGLELRQYINYEIGKYDDKEKLIKKYTKRLLEVEEKFNNLQKMSFSQPAIISPDLAEMQRQIDLLHGKIARIMERLNMS